MPTKLSVQKLEHLNTLVLRQLGGRDFFIAADNSIVISIPTLVHIIVFLIKNEYLSEKTIIGVLEECHTTEKWKGEDGVKDNADSSTKTSSNSIS